MEFGKKLKSLRLSQKLTQRDLSSAVGVSIVTIQNWENGVKTPSMAAIIKITSCLHVSADMLLGTGEYTLRDFVALSKEESAIIEDYRMLDTYGRQLVKTVCRMEKARIEADESSKIVQLESLRRDRFIPHYITPSAAGISAPLDGEDFEMMLVTGDVPEEADAAINIQGNSMAPYIQDGDMVFVKKVTELSAGDVGIFCVDGAMYCKQYYPAPDGDLYLVSANPAQKQTNLHITQDGGQSVQIYGRVLLGHKLDLPEYLFT